MKFILSFILHHAFLAVCWLLAEGMASGAEPHPAVVRVTVRDRDGSNSMGSGVYVRSGKDQNDKPTGLVLTNHHVIRDSAGAGSISVTFPDGFSSGGTVVGSDQQDDLAAIVVWRPNCDPMPLAESSPQQGEQLWIAGYGGSPTVGYLEQAGQARYEFVGDILTVAGCQARQGDSGGPIINSRGELAGVLDAAGSGFTIGANTNATTVFLTQFCGPSGCGRPSQPYYQQRPVVQTPAPRPQQPRQDYALPYRDKTAERLDKIEAAIKAGVGCKCDPNNGCKCEGLTERVTALEKQPIIHGENGKDGKDGKSIDPAEVAKLVIAQLGDIRCKCDEKPPAKDTQVVTHFVVVADRKADSWRKVADLVTSAQQNYSGIRVSDVPNFPIGQIPQLVEYRGATPVRTYRGMKEVEGVLYRVSRGEYPANL